MNSFFCAVAGYCLNALWIVPLAASAAWLAARILRSLGPRAQHLVWTAALVLAVILPVFPVLGSAFIPAHGSARILASSELFGSSAGPAAAHERGVTVLPFAVIRVLFGISIATLLWFAARLAWLLRCTRILRRGATPIALSAEQDQLWTRCLDAFSLSRVALLASPDIAGPLTVGVRSPAILAPTGFLDRCTPSEFLAALGHECAHIRRRDYAKNLVCEILTLPIGFHPVAWMLKSQLGQTREMICDAATAGALLDPTRYAESLLRLAAAMLVVPRAAQLHAIGIFDGHILEKRIMLIQTKRPALTLAARCALAVPGALLLVFAAVAGAAMTTAVAPQPATQSAPAEALGHVYKIADGVTAPVLKYAPDPEFPRDAFREKVHFQGVCVVGVVVDKEGMPREVHMVRSLRPDFDKQAMIAVRQYRFKPGMLQGNPVAVAIKIEVNFRVY